jgi:hypothetical protein
MGDVILPYEHLIDRIDWSDPVRGHVVIIDRTPDDLVREFSINEPLDCAPFLSLRLRMQFSKQARSDQHFREADYLNRFFLIPGVKKARIVDRKLVVTMRSTASW